MFAVQQVSEGMPWTTTRVNKREAPLSNTVA